MRCHSGDSNENAAAVIFRVTHDSPQAFGVAVGGTHVFGMYNAEFIEDFNRGKDNIIIRFAAGNNTN
jgi:hypothetical protein